MPAAKKVATKKPAKPATSLVLRTVRADMTSTNGFVWPQVGGVAIAPDWKSTEACGNGLHGWLYGQGDHSCSEYLDATAKWLVVEVESASIVMLGGKCKFERGTVLHIGCHKTASDYLIANEPQSAKVAVIGAVLECGKDGVLQGGALSVLTGGNYSTITGGDSSKITGDDSSKITGGDSSKITGGDYSKITGGDSSKITGGDYSKITGGYYSKITGGDYSTITGGDYSTITGGDSSKITGGANSVMHFQYWDGKRTRTVIAYVCEDGILPNVAYKLDANKKVVKA